MANWMDMGRDSLEASRSLLEQGHWRSSVSRAYFGLYSLVTAQLLAQGFSAWRKGRENPDHQQILAMLEHNLIDSSKTSVKRQVRRASTTVQRARVVADYGSGQTVDRSLAVGVLRDVHFVARQMGSQLV